MGYGGGYRYPHNFDGNYVVEEYLPDALRGTRIVEPSAAGAEKALFDRLARLRGGGSGDGGGNGA
jgi:putative ATPase